MSQVVIVLLVIVGMSVAFFSEIIPIPATALLVPMVLQLTGVLSFNEAFAGFSSSTVVSLFTLSILAGILKQTTFLTDLQGFVTKNLVTHKNGKRYVLLAAHYGSSLSTLTPMASSPQLIAYSAGKFTMKEFFWGSLGPALVFFAAFMIWFPVCIRFGWIGG